MSVLRPVVWLIAAAMSLSATAWTVSWLLWQQQGRLDTLRGAQYRAFELPTDGTAVSQSFPVPPGGTDSACAVVHNPSPSVRSVLILLQTDDAGRPAHVVARDLVAVRAANSDCAGVTVRPALTAAHSSLWLTVRPADSAGLNLRVTTSDVLAQGRFLIGGHERWGDLGIVVSAPRSTRWDAAWPKELPRPTRRSAVVGLVFIASSIAFAALILSVLGFATSSRHAVIAALLAPALVAVLHALTSWDPQPRPLSWQGEGRALIDELGHARIRTSWPTIGGAITVLTSDISSPNHRAIFALPETSISWPLTLAEPTSLDTAVALRQEAWTNNGDGATFTVSVSAGNKLDVLWSGHIDPFGDASRRRWHDVTLRLDRYVGQEITLTLVTSPGGAGNAVMDAAMWREPVLRRSVIR